MPATDIRTRSVALAAIAAGTFYTAQEVCQHFASRRGQLAGQDIIDGLQFWIVWVALTPIVVAAIRRWPVDSPPIAKRLGIHSAVALSLAVLHSVLNYVVISLVDFARHGTDPFQARPNGTAMVWDVFTGVLFYSAVVLILTALAFRRLYTAEQVGAEALRAALTQSKLDALRSQLRPHFLFNTLNAISVLVVEDSEKAQQLILRLSALLRRSLDEEADEVPLSEEIAFTKDYLDILHGRFGDRLSTALDVHPSVVNAMVPVFLLQPLVENAIEHGASEHRPTSVTVKVSLDGDAVCIAVTDNGPGIAGDDPQRDGIGLGNTRARLEHLYGTRSRVSYGAVDPESDPPGTCVAIRFPYREAVI